MPGSLKLSIYPLRLVSAIVLLAVVILAGIFPVLVLYEVTAVTRRPTSLRRWVSRWLRWRAGKATNTIRKIRPAIASTSTTSMMVKPFLVVDSFLLDMFVLSLFIIICII